MAKINMPDDVVLNDCSIDVGDSSTRGAHRHQRCFSSKQGEPNLGPLGGGWFERNSSP